MKNTPFSEITRVNERTPGKITATYERNAQLSPEKISLQRKEWTACANELHFTNLRHYTDDGFSGMSDNRPAYKQLLDLISQYTDIEKLDSETPNRLVRQIVVHEDIDADHVRHIRLEIHFNFQPIPAIDQYDPADQRPYLHPDHSDRYLNSTCHAIWRKWIDQRLSCCKNCNNWCRWGTCMVDCWMISFGNHIAQYIGQYVQYFLWKASSKSKKCGSFSKFSYWRSLRSPI